MLKQLFSLIVCFLVIPNAAAAVQRVALVIGNDNYIHVAPLEKAGTDATAVASKLNELDFDVTIAVDANRRKMNRTITQFTSQLEAGDTALVFFAGHGVEIDGENFLLPTDVSVPEEANEDFIKSESIGLSDLMRRIDKTGARTTLFFIDACRDNPFNDTSLRRNIGGARGLVRVNPPEGTFAVFSAGAGQQALDSLNLDDQNPNSVFTRLLLPKLATPGLEIRQLISELRLEVRDLARTQSHSQFPAYYDELVGKFYFSQTTVTTQKLELAFLPPEPKPQVQATPGINRNLADEIQRDFEIAQSINTRIAYHLFLERHGKNTDNFAVALAQELLRELDAKSQPKLPKELELAPSVTPPSVDEQTIIPPVSKEEPAPTTAPNTNLNTPEPEDSGPSKLRAAEQEKQREILRQTQRALNRLGCNAGVADGIIGGRTRSALSRFVKSSGKRIRVSDLGSLDALRVISAQKGNVCKIEDKEILETKKQDVALAKLPSLEGKWTGKSTCHPSKSMRITLRKVKENRYLETAMLVGGTAPTKGFVTVNGKKISGDIGFTSNVDWDGHQYSLRWNGTLSNDGKSYTAIDKKGCRITRTRVGN